MTICPYCGFDFVPSKNSHECLNVRGCMNCLNPFLEHVNDSTIAVDRLPGMRDIRTIAPAGSVIGNILSHLNKTLDALPVLPEIPQRIITMVHDPLTSMSELATLIQEDAVISLKILKLANSAYSAAVQEIKALDAACARLGLKIIANAVNAIANGNLYRSGSPKFRKMMHEQWTHALAVAHCADEIGVEIYGENNPIPFKAGLVHDIGMTILLDLITTKYVGNVGRLRETPELMIKVLEKYHTLAGLHIVQHWKLEREIAFSTLYHHNPDLTVTEDVRPLTDIVCLANDMACATGYGFGSDRYNKLENHPSAERLGISQEKLDTLQVGMSDKIDLLLDVLNLE